MVLLFNKLDVQLNWVKSVSKIYNRFQLLLSHLSENERVYLDIGLDMNIAHPIGALLGARILKSTPALCL